METVTVLEENAMSPQELVFGLEELVTLILEYVTPNSTKQDLLGYRTLGRLWAKCVRGMFKEPPFKICLEFEDMLEYKMFRRSKSFIPMEVTVKSWLSKRKLSFLQAHSDNVEILHLVGVEGVHSKLDHLPVLHNLRKLTVDTKFQMYYKSSDVCRYIDIIAERSRKLKVFKIIYDENVSRLFEKTLEGQSFPKLMTELKADNVDARLIYAHLSKSELANLSVVDLSLKHDSSQIRAMKITLKKYFSKIHLKTLKLHFQTPTEDFLVVYPMHYLEELETNACILTFDKITPLSVCLPKIKSLNCTGTSLTNLTTFVMEGSNYENLKSLTLHGSSLTNFNNDGLERGDRHELRILQSIQRLGFPAVPNLKSLTWKGFSNRVTDTVLPRIFANAKQLEELDVSLEHIMRLCEHYLKDEFNSLGGTNFNRLKTLSIHNKDPMICSKLLYSTISIALVDLKTIKLGNNILVDSYTKSLWEKSGREMVVPPIHIVGFEESQREMVGIIDTFNLYFGLGDIQKTDM